jgi:hypothetical protein
VAIRLDSSLAFRPNVGAAQREDASDSRAARSAGFAQALDSASGAAPAAPAEATVESLLPAAVARNVAATRTPLSGSQAAGALQAAWHGAVGRPPSPETLSILVGQWAHETGRGSAMLNYNFGGLKGAGPSGSSTVYATHEGFGASATQTRDRFRAYDSAQQGASDYLSLLQRRYPDAVQAAERGDAGGFVQALKSGGYFTGDPAAYTKSVASLAQRALLEGFDALGPSEASDSAPFAATLATTFGATPRVQAAAPGVAGTTADPLLAPAAQARGGDTAPAPGAYARSFADEVGRVELLMSALRIGQLGEKAG